MGIDWQAVLESAHELNLVSNFDVLGSAQKHGRMSIGTLANDNYQAMIEAFGNIWPDRKSFQSAYYGSQ